MTTKRRLILGMVGLLLAAFTIAAVPRLRQKAEEQRTLATLQTMPLDRVRAAAQAFAHDHPGAAAMVPLPDLIAGGYLHAADILEWRNNAAAVSVFTGDTNEFDPGEVLVRVRANDASDIELHADGSIQVNRP